jgi:hypothetical protein
VDEEGNEHGSRPSAQLCSHILSASKQKRPFQAALFLIPEKADVPQRPTVHDKNHTRRCAERLLLARADRPLQSKKKPPRNLALIHRYTIHLTASLRLEWDERRNPARLSARSSQYRWGISQSDEQKGRAGGWLGEGQLRYRDGHAYAWLRTRERKASCRSFAPHSDGASAPSRPPPSWTPAGPGHTACIPACSKEEARATATSWAASHQNKPRTV